MNESKDDRGTLFLHSSIQNLQAADQAPYRHGLHQSQWSTADLIFDRLEASASRATARHSTAFAAQR